jgi:hypothetical protein
MDKDSPRYSITSGGPGSSGTKCCGITTEILKDKNGTRFSV